MLVYLSHLHNILLLSVVCYMYGIIHLRWTIWLLLRLFQQYRIWYSSLRRVTKYGTVFHACLWMLSSRAHLETIILIDNVCLLMALSKSISKLLPWFLNLFLILYFVCINAVILKNILVLFSGDTEFPISQGTKKKVSVYPLCPITRVKYIK